MPENINISLTIVTHNEADKAAAAAASIIAHCNKYPLSFYIIDNNSTDDTLKRLEFQDGIKIIRLNKNIGFGAAHNKALDYIDSDYHFIVNPDITINRDVLADMVAFMEENKNVVMAMPKILNHDGTEQFLPKERPNFRRLFLGRFSKEVRSEYVWQNKDIAVPTEIDFCSGCFFCIRTSALKELGGFDERFFMYLEDADLTIRAKSIGKVVILPDIFVTHLWQRGSAKNIRLFLIHLISCFKFLLKWRG
ncbi:MAG: glycosyltransferase family 2 protein [Clostridia bacterium]|nr:glycosyltransferase family 2 protein [Clostridia bacterium]